jgi:oxygen-independent coproporphyrinogen III oxidase
LIGLGVSAIGQAPAAYAQNEKNLQQYETRVAAGELPLQRGHVQSAEDHQIRELLWSVFAGGRATPGAALQSAAWWPQARAELESLRADGLVDLQGEALAATESGRTFLRRIAMVFDRRLPQAAAA